ncbi:MAG: hypothetical protein QXJ51_00875 [Sulfolobales archaeon]
MDTVKLGLRNQVMASTDASPLYPRSFDILEVVPSFKTSTGSRDLDSISRDLKKLFVFKEVNTMIGIEDPELDLVLRDLFQDWVHMIGYPPYREDFIERLLRKNIRIFEDHEKLISLENLVEVLGQYFRESTSDRNMLEDLYSYVKEELEILGISDIIGDLDHIDRENILRYVAYGIYIIVVSNLDLL